MVNIMLQIIIILCFIGLLIALFFDSRDYLIWAVFFVFIIGIATRYLLPLGEEEEHGIIHAIDWEVIIFLFCLFTIVEILNEHSVFQNIALLIVNKYKNSPRKMFYVISISSTLIATIIEDLSVAIMFIPIIIRACRELDLNPTPYLFGVTICINLASTLTPFGSAENVIIAYHFNLSLHWHLVYLGIYFLGTTAITLYILDKWILTKFLPRQDQSVNEGEIPGYFSFKDSERNRDSHIQNHAKIKYPSARFHGIRNRIHNQIDSIDTQNTENLQEFPETQKLRQKIVNSPGFKKNIGGLCILMGFLIMIPNIMISGIMGLMLFVFLNPISNQANQKPFPSLSYYVRKIDSKLIYFFILLFMIVYFMELAGLTAYIESLVERWAEHNIFWVSVEILLITSLLSGFLDDAPITILFLPIIGDLIPYHSNSNSLFIAFTLGINLGGNFLPQGAACDMMTLELAQKNQVKEFTYRYLLKVGASFALLHILLGIGYIALFNFLF